MKEINSQEDRLDYLVEEFKADSGEYRDLQTPNDILPQFHERSAQKSISLSFRASAHTGVGIPPKTTCFPWDRHTSLRTYFAMTNGVRTA